LAKVPKEIIMCDTVGVAKRLDLESISKDIAELVKQLGKEVEGPVKTTNLKKIETKVQRIMKG
jgi:ribosomal protein S10